MDNKSKNGTPPPALVGDNAEAARRSRRERGFTLQTLIVTAVLVLVAGGTATVLWAVTRGASDNTESAGRVSVETWCSPNEVRDADSEANARRGTNRILNHEITSDRIGCYPVCGTWEYYDPGLKAAGTGGPQGNGGVYSSDIGCFAPCYWSHDVLETSIWRPDPSEAIGELTRLSYHDDDRPPGINQIRLGVNYRRLPASEIDSHTDVRQTQDLQLVVSGARGSRDRTPTIYIRPPRSTSPGGSRVQAGELPLHSRQIALGFPTVFKPNWFSGWVHKDPADPGGSARKGTKFEDENWDYRVDPYNEVCTIVDTTLDDKVVCSSEWENCGSS